MILEIYKNFYINIDLENRRGIILIHSPDKPVRTVNFERVTTGIQYWPDDKLPVRVIKLITHHLYSRIPKPRE